jgi:cytochrome c553
MATHRQGALCAAALAAALLAAPALRAGGAEPPPAWAYPVLGERARTDPAEVVTVPGSPARFTRADVKNMARAVDWRPDLHPPAPAVVLEGPRPDVQACGYCHLPNGQGRPENASLAGLPAAYIGQQTQDLREGTRLDGVPDYAPGALMRHVAAAVTPGEVAAAAAYFAALPYRSHVRVVEAAAVPRTVQTGFVYRLAPGGGRETLGARIIETPDDWERFEARDAAVTYTAYVPPGAIARGEALARTGADGRSQPCTACHGATLAGAAGPPIAGRSPTYLFRQLYTFETGARHGAGAAPMAAVAAHLNQSEMINLAAYVGSLRP